MPVAAPVGCTHRYDDQVTDTRGDLLLAAGAQVGFVRLEGVDAANLHGVIRVRAATVPRHE